MLAAGGKTGRHLVEQALHPGDTVIAVVRDPTRLPVRHDRLAVVMADVFDPAAIGPAVAGADAVISALGPRSYRQASSIISAGTASILDAMRAAGTLPQRHFANPSPPARPGRAPSEAVRERPRPGSVTVNLPARTSWRPVPLVVGRPMRS